MAVTALHSAATGLSALSTELDIISNNLANVNTLGFKSSRANFENLLYQEKMQPGVENAAGDQRPAGLFVGLGTRISNTQLNFKTGDAIETGNDYDMMVNGAGFFQVQYTAEGGANTAYTRAGNFFRNSQGNLVLGNSEGPLLQPGINIPDGVTDLNININGEVFGVLPGATEPQNFGQIELANFVNPNGLKPIGGNLFLETAASGQPITGNPAEGTFGKIMHKYIESSNVDPVGELVSLIKTQRAFEMNSQSIKAADESLQVISNLRR